MRRQVLWRTCSTEYLDAAILGRNVRDADVYKRQLQDSRDKRRKLMGVMADHAKVIAILVIPWVAAFDVVDFLLQPSFSVCIICLHRQRTGRAGSCV